MKTGRKGSCKVYNIVCVKNGCQMIVSYRGESGTEYKQSLWINMKDAMLLKPDMWVECYLQGEDCYVDASHIKVVEKLDDEF